MVDDDSFNVKCMVKRLKAEKYNFDSANNGQIAIDKVKLNKSIKKCCPQYKLIIMDIDMPIKDGFQASKEISEFYKSLDINDY